MPPTPAPSTPRGAPSLRMSLPQRAVTRGGLPTVWVGSVLTRLLKPRPPRAPPQHYASQKSKGWGLGEQGQDPSPVTY